MAEFTHFNESGRARMVDVSAKDSTERAATAQATVFLQPETLEKIQRGKIAKGDVLSVAQVAGVMGAKKTPDLIPMFSSPVSTSHSKKNLSRIAKAAARSPFWRRPRRLGRPGWRWKR